MSFLDASLSRVSGFSEAAAMLSAGQGPVFLTGVSGASEVHMMDLAGRKNARLVVTYDERSAKVLEQDLRFFTDEVYYFPAKDLLFYQADMRSNIIERERMRVLRILSERRPVTVVTTIRGVMNILPPKENFEGMLLHLSVGLTAELQAVSERLVSLGYERVAKTEAPGEFAIHGGILDIFDLTEEAPFRIEFWGDEIDTIRFFNPETQLSVENLQEAVIYPATELFLTKKGLLDGFEKLQADYEKNLSKFKKKDDLSAGAALQSMYRELEEEVKDHMLKGALERFAPYFYGHTETVFDYMPDGTAVFLDDPVRLKESASLAEYEYSDSFKMRLQKGSALPLQSAIVRSAAETFAMLSTGRTMAFSGLDTAISEIPFRRKFRLRMEPVVSYAGNFQGLVTDLAAYEKNKTTVVLLCPSATRGERIAEDLRSYHLHAYFEERPKALPGPGRLLITKGRVTRGFTYPEAGFVLLAESDLYGSEKRQKRRKKKAYEGQKIASFSELNVGDYVVHENYGIGIYRGIKKMTADGVERDYLEIRYGDSGTLYIPVTNLDVVQKYAAADAKPPKINRLDSPDWKKTKSRVHAAVSEVAEELVALYAERQDGTGFAFSPDCVLQHEFEELFPFEETEDQLTAIEETKRDMESHKIMDRLICGDVGFGKTEVAIRAAFKAVCDGKQVAYLVPTTILAEQHYNTFTQRLRDFAVSVGMLSRFRTAREQKDTIAGIKNGTTDILIGTHRILSKDVKFKNLGLLIIDEEQRFGVSHKEKIKQMKTNVDVLTLTATPIPRTLHMSMIGVRDMSVLEEPPVDRQAIQTYVMEYSEELVREAVSRELSRGGQVYYVYNRVADIEEITGRVRALVPEARVSFAHGKMNERELEDRMMAFINGEIDVLVSTTIIETGLDIPNVNTIIIHDAERYGLSQLYQLRGRVGRSARQAYAFIMYRKDRIPGEETEKRLEAIRQFTELGSGIKIAMRDLEIRGAGAVLGNAQSGHMTLVGYELYCKMLSQAVKKARGEEDGEEKEIDTVIDVKLSAFIPSEYIVNERLKLETYKRISILETEEDREALLDELIDRYGEPPRPVTDLLEVAVLRAMARSLYISEIGGNAATLTFKFLPDASVKGENIPVLIEKMKGAMSFIQNPVPALRWHEMNALAVGKTPVLFTIRSLLSEIKELLI